MKLFAGILLALAFSALCLPAPSTSRPAAVVLSSVTASAPPVPAQGRDDEIVADLAEGQVIVHVTKDNILFATIEQAEEAGSLGPRVVSIDATHIGVLLGAAQWQIPAGSAPVRIERSVERVGRPKDVPASRVADENTDLEMVAEAYLEALRPLAEKLHHPVDFRLKDPLLVIVVIGYAPRDYGPEVWLYEYRMAQEQLRGDYVRTRILRPRTVQLYPPEKHEPRTLIEVRYPPRAPAMSLQQKIQQNDLAVARLASSDPKFARVVEKIQAGKANHANATDAADFLRAAVVPLAGKARFTVGTMSEDRGLDWLVPPEEPIQKAKEDKDRPPDAPTLRRKPQP